MDGELDLPDTGCWTTPASDVQVGDVHPRILLPYLEAVEGRYDPGSNPPEYFLEARFTHVLVIAHYGGYALIAPIALLAVASDADAFKLVAKAGRDAPHWVRLPPLGGAWNTDAVALLFKAQAVLAARLRRDRIASMSDEATSRLKRRVARAFEA